VARIAKQIVPIPYLSGQRRIDLYFIVLHAWPLVGNGSVLDRLLAFKLTSVRIGSDQHSSRP
jgi:hypothetical protein